MIESIVEKTHKYRWILYILILVICTFAIFKAVYPQYSQEQQGIGYGKVEDEKDEDENNQLISDFTTLFTNDIYNKQEGNINVTKIRNEYDIVTTAYSYIENKDNYNLDVSIPYININTPFAIKCNEQTTKDFKQKAEGIIKTNSTLNTVYTVKYKAYIQNNILSLVIRSELREGNQSQKMSVKTYNYDIVNNKEVTLSDLLNLKNITEDDANSKIKTEIEKIQKQNQSFADLAYNIYQRDINSDRYKIENTTEYFLGKDGILYLVYTYGDEGDTNDKDIVIFK